jgi:hypothetical protein
VPWRFLSLRLTEPKHAAWREIALLVLALAGLLAVVYLPIVFGGQTFAAADHVRFTLPARAQLVEALRAGRVPEWWDGVQFGVDVAATPYYQSAYPPAWPVALFGAAYGADLVVLGHLLLGGVGLAFWARRLGASAYGAFLGGALFMLGGYMSSIVVLHSAAMSPAWIPWVAWSADRLAKTSALDRARWPAWLAATAVAAVPLSMVVLAGDPTAAITGGMVGLLVAGVRAPRPLRAAALEVLAGVAAVGLSAVVLLPALRALPESMRAQGWDKYGFTWSLHPLSLLQLVWPDALGKSLDPSADLARVVADTTQGASGMAPAWASSIFFGWIALGLAAYAVSMREVRGIRGLAIGSLFFVLLALGAYTPAYGWFRAVVWPEHFVRYPAKHFAGVVVLWSGLSAVGLEGALRDARKRRVWIPLLVSLAVTVVVAILVGAGDVVSSALRDGRALPTPVEAGRATDAILAGGWSTLAATAGFGAAAFAATRERFARWAAPAAVAILARQLGVHAHGLIPRVPRDEITAEGVLVGVPHDPDPDAPRHRLYREQRLGISTEDPQQVALALARTAADNMGALHGFAHIPGYAPATSTALWRRLLEASIKEQAVVRVLSFLGVDYAISSSRMAGFDIVTLDQANSLAILRNTRARTRAFVTARWKTLDDDDAVLKSMLAPSSDLDAVRFSAADPHDSPREDGADAGTATPCTVRAPRPERVELQCSSPDAGYAVLVDAWAPGWSATVDDVPAAIERADTIMRAVRVGPGPHRIVFTFRSPGLRAGAGVSLGACLVLACLAGVPRLRRKRTADTRIA